MKRCHYVPREGFRYGLPLHDSFAECLTAQSRSLSIVYMVKVVI